MARIDNLNNFLTDVADSIRTKKGTTDVIPASNFDTEIASIETGGDIPEVGYVITKFTSNGIPSEIKTYGYTNVPRGLFSSSSSDYIYGLNRVTKIILNKGFGSEGETPSIEAFQNLYKLEEIDMSDLDDTSMGTWDNAFYNCKSLKSIDLNKITGYIGLNCFYGCFNLELTRFPDNVYKLSSGAFRDCTSITLEEGLNKVNNIGFYNSSISGFTFHGCSNLQPPSLPENLIMTGGNNFSNCKKLAIKKVPDAWEYVNSYTFQNCIGLTEMNLANVTNSSNYGFDGCTSLEKVTSTKLITIGQNGFSNCSSLKYFDFPNTLTTINNTAFYKCSSLEKIKIDTTESFTIGLSSFRECTGLISALLNNVKTINGTSSNTNGSFLKCTSLKYVWIGSSITSSGFYRYAFQGCTNLIKMFINLPRETVEAFTNYQYAFMNDTSKTGIIICNDDEGFMTKDEFDAIDWSTYTEEV